jgi:multidrug efflux pump subunit AcrA (membrane-fusion protein)
MPVSAPRDGVLWEVWVSQGQTVASSALLFEVIDLDPVWVRVPVYVGDLATVSRDRPVRVRKLGVSPSDLGVAGRPIAAPPSADPLAASAHLFFEVRNSSRAFRPHERVEVAIPLRGLQSGLVVPWAAVVFDIQGGAWVYEQVQPHVFARRRVEIRHVANDLALLERGPAPGAAIVTAGAAELFGTEFGTGK